MAAGDVGAIQNLGYATKNIFKPQDMEVVLNEELKFRPWLKKGAPTGASATEGYEVQFNMFLDPPQNVGQTTDGSGTFAPSKARTEVRCTIKPSLHTASFQIGLMASKLITSNKTGFGRGELRRKVEETLPSLGKHIETTYVAGTGNGVRAIVASDAVASFVCADPIGVKLIRPNMLISVRQGTGTTVRDSVDLILVTGVDVDTKTVYYEIGNVTYGTNGEKTVVAGDRVYVVTETTQSIAQTLGVGTFANGIRNLLDNGIESTYLHTLDRTTTANMKLNSIVDDNGGARRALNEDMLNQNMHKVYDLTQKKVTDFWCGPGVAMEWSKVAIPDRQIVLQGTNPLKWGSGFRPEDMVHHAVGVAAQWHVSYDMVPGELFGITPSTLFLYEGTEMGWWDEAGGMLKPMPGTNTYKPSLIALAYCIENIGTTFPRGNFVIRDLASPYDGLEAAEV